jgi:hypothetical protein
MFEYIKKLWNDRGFEIVGIVCILLICVLAITRIGKKGSWSTSYVYNNKQINNKSENIIKHTQPKESKGERECRRVLQKFFNKEFKNCRPDFLLNPVTGGRYNLELDCYDDSLKLAVEYNGIQHYKFVPYFHKNKEAFYNQKYRDDMKRRLCKDNKVNLIEVPNTVDISDIEEFLRQKLKMLGYLK